MHPLYLCFLETVEIHRAPPPPLHEKPPLNNINVFLDDNEPVYDSVASDDDDDGDQGRAKSGIFLREGSKSQVSVCFVLFLLKKE